MGKHGALGHSERASHSCMQMCGDVQYIPFIWFFTLININKLGETEDLNPFGGEIPCPFKIQDITASASTCSIFARTAVRDFLKRRFFAQKPTGGMDG